MMKWLRRLFSPIAGPGEWQPHEPMYWFLKSLDESDPDNAKTCREIAARLGGFGPHK